MFMECSLLSGPAVEGLGGSTCWQKEEVLMMSVSEGQLDGWHLQVGSELLGLCFDQESSVWQGAPPNE